MIGREVIGFVSLVGAGPGDPGLLTWRAVQRLGEADLVLHDGLVPEAMLDLAVSADRVRVSKRPGDKAVTQSAVTALMIAAAREGRRVVRLKAGDPFVLGRGGEEALALAEAGVPFEVIPGISAAVAAPMAAGIPVTHRGVSSAFVVVSGHAPDAYGPVLDGLPPQAATVVVLMGFAERGRIAERLQARGWAADTAAAIVANASQPGQHVWTGTLGALGHAMTEATADDAQTIVIGEVVAIGAAIAMGMHARRENRSHHGHDRGSDLGPGATIVRA